METLFSTETQTAMQFPQSNGTLQAPKDIPDSFIGIPKSQKGLQGVLATTAGKRVCCSSAIVARGKSLMARGDRACN